MTSAARALLPCVLPVLLAAGACASTAERARPDAGPLQAASLVAVPVAVPEPRATLRVIARKGEVSGVDSDAAPAADRLVRLAPAATLQLALADFARLSVQGPATLLLGPAGAPALLLRDGVVTVDCAAPVLPTAAPALWIATPAARLEVAQRARFVLRADPRASVLSLASGTVRVRQGDTVHDLADDATTCLGARSRWAHRPLRGKLEARSKAMRGLLPCAHVVGEPSDALLGAELREVLASLAQAAQRGRDLTVSHRALSQADPRAAATQQRAISLHASAAMRLSDEVRTRRSVLAARTLTADASALRALLAQAERAAP